MAKIADVIKLKTGYANFVELKSAFEAARENADRMAVYRPTKSHRQAFERICRGLYRPPVTNKILDRDGQVFVWFIRVEIAFRQDFAEPVVPVLACEPVAPNPLVVWLGPVVRFWNN